MSFMVEKEFMVVKVNEVTSKKGNVMNFLELLDWEGGKTTEFLDFDQSFSELKPKTNVIVRMRIINSDNGGWRVYLNEIQLPDGTVLKQKPRASDGDKK